MIEKRCGNCLHRCMDMDLDPYCSQVNKPYGRVLRTVPTECCIEERKLWNMDTRPMSMNALQNHVHDVAKSKGWWDSSRLFNECIVLIHSEVSEALESYRRHEDAHWNNEGKPDGYGIELGDVFIRILDTCASQDWSLAEDLTVLLPNLDGPNSAWRRIQSKALEEAPVTSFVDGLLKIHDALTGAHFSMIGARKALAQAAIATFALAEHSCIDLEAMVKIKVAFNETRPHRHGGKRL